MSYLINIVGTHGAGKTTLSFKIATFLKELGKNVKLVQEVARSCPFPINQGMTQDAALWIYHEHCRKELEASKDHQFVISDRSCLDPVIYALHFDLDIDPNLKKVALKRLEDYSNLIIFVEADMPIEEDGVRSTDQNFQIAIEDLFYETLPTFKLSEKILVLKSSQIFDKEESWKSSFLSLFSPLSSAPTL